MKPELTVGIPTFGRDDILLATLDSALKGVDPQRMEIVVVDQRPRHTAPVSTKLAELNEGHAIRLLELDRASLTHARNIILREARAEVVLFLDDDMLLPPTLFDAHLSAYRDPSISAVTGQVYNCTDYAHPPDFSDPSRGTTKHVAYEVEREANNISGGNHSVRRAAAIRVGGYDERFHGAALGEDMDFSRRLLNAGCRIQYRPDAWVIHLAFPRGGCSITGEGQWKEWTHSASLWLYLFRHSVRQGNMLPILWMTLRNGPLRKEVVRDPLRWLPGWWGWLKGAVYGYRHRRSVDSEFARKQEEG